MELGILPSPQRTYPNLFDSHTPFQIDGSFGGTAGITEMLQSWGGSIFLLPALPKAWPDGALRRMAGVDLQWKVGRLTRASLHSDKGGDYELAYWDHPMKLRLRADKTAHVVLSGDRLARA